MQIHESSFAHLKDQPVTPIEERVSRLEKAAFGLKAEPARDDWQRSVGMFRGDSVMKEILDDVREAREREREAARESDNTEK